MNDPMTITEVVGRAVQGMTKPFLCKAEFAEYYVKGAYAGKNSLCCEWVANRLVKCALPSAPLGQPMFEMGEVAHALIEGSGFPDIRELGEGLVFASLRIEDGQELTWSAAQGWSEETMALLLLLDLWIQNEDRSLSELGGNPNLLVTQIPPLPADDPEGALWVDQPIRDTIEAGKIKLADPEQKSLRYRHYLPFWA